jgi:VanZ family protein
MTYQSTDQPINRPTDQRPPISTRNTWKIALLIWLGILLLSSTSEVGEFVTEFYRNYLRTSVRDYGVSSHEAQKFLHVVLFAVLGWLLAYTKLPPRPAWVRGLVWSFAVGAVTELLQILARGRHPLFSDVILNGATGALTCWLVLRFAPRRPAGT